MSRPVGSPSSSLVAYSTKGKLPAFPVNANMQLDLYNLRAFNNSGSSQNMGVMRLGVIAEEKLWQYAASGPTYTDVTSTIASGVNIFDTTNGDGFVAQSRFRFGMLGFTISTAGTGSPVFTYKYYNGTSFTTLTTLEVPSYASTGDIWIVFIPPSDWAQGGAASLVSNQYSLQVIATTAPTLAVTVNNMWIAEFLEFYQAVPNNGIIQVSFGDNKPFQLHGGEAIIPYFSTPNAANVVGCYYVPHL
jgi:hypothetical protein